MKKELSPGTVAAIIACVVVIAGFLLWKSNADKPAYPGAEAGKPAAESGGGDTTKPSSAPRIPDHAVSQEEAKKLRIPGVSH